MYHMVAPGAHFSPAVQDCHTFHAVRCCSLDIVIKHTEFLADFFNILYKIRELQSQLQITAVTDSLDRASENRSSCCHPVYFRFFYRIATFMERIREKVWQKSSFCIFHIFNITEQPQCCTISNTSHNCIQSDGSKLVHKRLHADPVISHKHHGFLSIFMDNIYHFFCKLGDFSSLECLEIFKFL